MLLVVDEIGYFPVARSVAVLFFQLFNRRYEDPRIVLTSGNGFEEWGRILGDAADGISVVSYRWTDGLTS